MDDLDGSTGTKPGQQAGHVTVSVSTTKKPIRWTTLAPIGQRSFFAYAQRGDWHPSPHCRCVPFAVCSREILERGQPPLSNGEQVNRLAALSLKRGQSVDFGGHWQ